MIFFFLYLELAIAPQVFCNQDSSLTLKCRSQSADGDVSLMNAELCNQHLSCSEWMSFKSLPVII